MGESLIQLTEIDCECNGIKATNIRCDRSTATVTVSS